MFEVSSLATSQFANPIFTQNPLDFSSSSTSSLNSSSSLFFSQVSVDVELRFLRESMNLQQRLIGQNEELNEERSRLFVLNNFNDDLSDLLSGIDESGEDLTTEEREDLILRQRDLVDDLSDLQRNSQFNGRELLDDPSIRSLTSQLNDLDFNDEGVFTEMASILDGSSDLMADLISNSENAIETQELEISLTEGLQSTYFDLSQQFSSNGLSSFFDTDLISAQPSLAFSIQSNQLNSQVANSLLQF